MDDPSPPGPGQVQVGFAEHDRLRRAQRRVVQDGEERFQVQSSAWRGPVCLSLKYRSERLGSDNGELRPR